MELDNLQKFNALNEIADDYKKDRPLENEIYLRDKLLGNKEKVRKPIKPQLFSNGAKLTFTLIGFFVVFILTIYISISIGAIAASVSFICFFILTPLTILFICSLLLKRRFKILECYLAIFEWVGIVVSILMAWYFIPLVISLLAFKDNPYILANVTIGVECATVITIIIIVCKILSSEKRKKFREDMPIFTRQKSTFYSSLIENLKFEDIKKEEMTDEELRQLIFSYYPELKHYLKKADLNNIDEKLASKICDRLFDEIMNFEIELQKRQKRRIKNFKKYISKQYFVDVMKYNKAESEILLNCICNKYKQNMNGFEDAYNEVEANYYNEIKAYLKHELEDISTNYISNEEKMKYPSVYVDYLVKTNEENLNVIVKNMAETGCLLTRIEFEEEVASEENNIAETTENVEKIESLVWDTLDDDIRKHYINAQIKSLYNEQLAQESNLTREIRAIRKESLLSNEFYIEDLTKTEKTNVLEQAKVEFEKDKERYMTLAVKELYTKQLKDDQKHSTLTREQRAIKRECLDLNEFPLEDLNEEEKVEVQGIAIKLFRKGVLGEKTSKTTKQGKSNKKNYSKGRKVLKITLIVIPCVYVGLLIIFLGILPNISVQTAVAGGMMSIPLFCGLPVVIIAEFVLFLVYYTKYLKKK